VHLVFQGTDVEEKVEEAESAQQFPLGCVWREQPAEIGDMERPVKRVLGFRPRLA
jgi:hypothetical protein